MIAPPSSAAKSDAIPRSQFLTSQFDGEWRVVATDGEYCRTPGQSYVRQWTITNGVVVAPGGNRGTVSITGEVRLSRVNDRSRTVVTRVLLNGSEGRGKFLIEGTRCGGTISLTRM